MHDYRDISSQTQAIQHPCHSMRQGLDCLTLGRPRVFRKSDASNGYWAIPLLESDEYKTGFIAQRGMFAYRVCAQGLKYSMHRYVRSIRRLGLRCLPPRPGTDDPEFPSVLGVDPQRGDAFAVYVDDHCFSHTDSDSHFDWLHNHYFPRVAFGPIPLAANKTKLFQSSMEAFGMYVSQGCIRPPDRY